MARLLPNKQVHLRLQYRMPVTRLMTAALEVPNKDTFALSVSPAGGI